MKKYFAKFLAVEGYIKEEDFYFANNELFRADSKFKPDNRNNPNGRGYKKVKLFLCSRDIQYVKEVKSFEEACEKVKHQSIVKRDGKYYQIFFGSEHDSELEIEYAVIGEISPEATWVKEGDEFEKDEVQKYINLGMSLGRLPDPNIWEIKGPCGHFH